MAADHRLGKLRVATDTVQDLHWTPAACKPAARSAIASPMPLIAVPIMPMEMVVAVAAICRHVIDGGDNTGGRSVVDLRRRVIDGSRAIVDVGGIDDALAIVLRRDYGASGGADRTADDRTITAAN